MSSLLDSIKAKISKLTPTEAPAPKTLQVMFMCNGCSYNFKHGEPRYVCTECAGIDLCKKCYKRDQKYFQQHPNINQDRELVGQEPTDSSGHLQPPLLHTDSAPLPHSFTLETKAQREMTNDNVGKTTYDSMRHSFRDNKKRQCIGVREKVEISEKYPNGLGEYKWMLFEQFEELVEYFGQALREFVQRRSFVSICANNRTEWYVADIACMFYGLPVVPMHHQVNSDAMGEILSNSETRVIVSSIDICASKVVELIDSKRYDGLKLVVVLEDTSNTKQYNQQRLDSLRQSLPSTIEIKTYAEMLTIGKKLFSSSKTAHKHDPMQPEEIISLVYTSGSTGVPKGVITLDKEWNAQISESYMSYPSSSISYLTLSHSQRRFDHKKLYVGTRIGIFSGTMDLLFDDIQKIRPSIFWGVPRVWNLIYSLYQNELDQFIKLNPSSSKEYCEEKCLKKIKNVLGDRLEAIVTGGAPTSEEVLKFMKNCWPGVGISNSYGLSEVIGIFIDGYIQHDIEFRIDPVPEFGYYPTDLPNPRGELLVKSKTMTTGYYNNPQLTAESFQDGWFKTGDIVEQIGSRKVKIIDRKKHAFKLSNGEFVAPELIENIFMGSNLIEQILIYGDAMKTFLVAIIIPRKHVLDEFGLSSLLDAVNSNNNNNDQTEESIRIEKANILNQNKPLLQKLSSEIFNISLKKKMANYEIPKMLRLDLTKWTTDNELITGSGKFCRGKLYKYYKNDIDNMYNDLSINNNNNIQQQQISTTNNNEENINSTLMDYLKNTLQIDSANVGNLNDFSFTQLGGDSLSAIRLSNLLKDKANINIAPSIILNNNNNLTNLSNLINNNNNCQDYNDSVMESINWNQEFMSLDKSIDIGDKKIGEIPVDSPIPIDVFLTGATGFLGSFILHQLLGQENVGRIYCLVRSKDSFNLKEQQDKLYSLMTEKYKLKLDQTEMERVVPINGDLSLTLLGLRDQESFKELANSVDLIIHNGATVNMVIPYANLRATNVGATCEIFKLAAAGEKIKPVSFISTMGVFAYQDKDIQESDVPPTDHIGQMTGYSQSKLVAEQIVRYAYKRGFPVCMFRPATIYCDSTSGIDNDHDFVRMIFKGLIELGACPDINTIHAGGVFNLSPVDWVSQSIVNLSLTNQSYTRKHHHAPIPIYHMINEEHVKLERVTRILSTVQPMQEVPFQQFQQLVGQVQDHNHAIYPIRSVFKNNFPGHYRFNYYCPFTTKQLFSLGLDKCPKVSNKTIELNLIYLKNQLKNN
ncbi:hypothetical protein DFA_09189 [Cavenderia fasciculata]|uniref:Carrier domain-containing protein n=1 Tax=Cavenderia fasciculata TaxID=261658 RepID=F4Q6Y0_CACFS|nr:uncharacterized protein DFA_09189 [Cavenderia fasciculata]EGG16162.1 hypothetical protein DFA_09189 [Cavenderia fasciculata]|eukprot:XP_004352615.1 hypothetical protein DFA_09189 [Cavenderia fasciculata]